jgi:hypothetical protein
LRFRPITIRLVAVIVLLTSAADSAFDGSASYSLRSEDIERTAKMKVTAQIKCLGRQDDDLEKLVGRSSRSRRQLRQLGAVDRRTKAGTRSAAGRDEVRLITVVDVRRASALIDC